MAYWTTSTTAEGNITYTYVRQNEVIQNKDSNGEIVSTWTCGSTTYNTIPVAPKVKGDILDVSTTCEEEED